MKRLLLVFGLLTGLLHGQATINGIANQQLSGVAPARTVISVSSSTTAAATANTDYLYLCSGTITLTLPTAVGNKNLYVVKNVGSGTITVKTTSAQTIDSAQTQTIAVQNGVLSAQSDNANWQRTN